MSSSSTRYENVGPVDCTNEFDTKSVAGMTAIVTGGASGMGAAYVRALAEAGATVVIGDLNKALGEQVAGEFSSVHFSACDVTKWEDQLALFRKAKSVSSSGKIDIVIANAGIAGPDPVFLNSEEPAQVDEPEEPKLNILAVDLAGYLYTVKLALHSFQRQFSQDRHSTSCLVLMTSIAAYLTQPGSPQYMAAMFGKRGLMRCLRETSLQHGTRINSLAPWFVRTGMNDAIADRIIAKGVIFAQVEDAAAALMRIVTDDSMHGRNLAVLPRMWADRGYVDLDQDDHAKETLLDEMQQIVLRTSHRLEVYLEKQIS